MNQPLSTMIKEKAASSPSQTELKTLCQLFAKEEERIREGTGKKGKERQERLGRLTARQRIHLLLDKPEEFFEIMLWAGYEMYPEWGNIPAGGIIAGIGKVSKRSCMIIACDATVKAGAAFPAGIKKILRSQRIAYECRLPILYLVDSSGVFLPLQDEIFPDEDDFGRIFRNNAVLSAAKIPQYAAVMGNCIAGGAYLPVLADKLLMTEGSGLYLAGPALVKAAIGQEVDTEELGGAKMHAEISGTVDFHEKDDPSCIQRLRNLVALLPEDPPEKKECPPQSDPENVFSLVSKDGQGLYDAKELIATIIDQNSFQEYKADYGKSLITGYAHIQGHPVGIVANQRLHTQSETHGVEIGGVIYRDSADKAARFVMDCNQTSTPLLFLQDVMGFMVGKEAEQNGIIRCGAKLVNAVSNSVVPKITVVVGNSFGAGNYALCGKAYDPNFIVAWPNARYAVMGADQAAGVVFSIQKKAAERSGKTLDEEQLQELHQMVQQRYQAQTDIRYGAARGWIDAIIAPEKTREIVANMLILCKRRPDYQEKPFHTGVLQV